MLDLRRREFITLLGAAAWPLAARAQQPALPVIGFLNSASPDLYQHLVRAFHQGLAETGNIDGRNVTIEYRWAQGRNDRLSAMAVDLVRRHVTVIFANSSSALPAKAATTTIPIVFVTAADPVELGLVASLNRPGGNLTGVSNLAVELGPKRVELLHELVPAATVMAALVNPTDPNAQRLTRDLQASGSTLGLQMHVLQASNEREITDALANLRQLRAGSLVISPDPFFTGQIQQIAALAIHHAVPAIFQYREFGLAGGLMSYGGSLTDMYRLAGVYTGRILKGENPAELPVQQSTRVELIINLKTAKTLGLEIPPTLLARADEIIE
jgi:putative ABC transport system substrate-binding protein